MRCVNCGQPLGPGDAFCPRCGGASGAHPVHPGHDTGAPAPVAPPVPARTGFRLPPLVVGLVLVLAAAGAGGVLLSRHHAGATPHSAAGGVSSPAPQPVEPAVPSVADSAEVTPSSTEPEQPLDSTAARTALDHEVAQDRAAAEQLIGTWVPQLSSKRVGLVADGITYGYPEIWANFQELRSEYPDALLIWSGDYVSFKLTDFYVTIVPEPYSDGELANQWCDGAGLAPTDCYAKFLSHEGGSAGTTLLRN